MDNRRNDYRHTFPAEDRLRVEIILDDNRTIVAGDVVNLSVTGMAVELEEAHSFRVDDRCTATFSIPHGLRRFALDSEVIHTMPTAGGGHLGLHFRPLDNGDAQDEREKALWVFLLDEQRRLRPRMRGEAER
jgi:hypothetical protein